MQGLGMRFVPADLRVEATKWLQWHQPTSSAVALPCAFRTDLEFWCRLRHRESDSDIETPRGCHRLLRAGTESRVFDGVHEARQRPRLAWEIDRECCSIWLLATSTQMH